MSARHNPCKEPGKDCGLARACFKNAWTDDEGYHDCPGWLADGRLCICDCHVTEPPPDPAEDSDLVQLRMFRGDGSGGANEEDMADDHKRLMRAAEKTNRGQEQ